MNGLRWSREELQLAQKRGEHAYQTGATTNDCPYKADDVRRTHWLQGFVRASESVLGTRVEVELECVEKVWLHVADGNPESMLNEARRKCPGFRVNAVGEQTLVTHCEGCSKPLFEGDDYLSGDECCLCRTCYDEEVEAGRIEVQS